MRKRTLDCVELQHRGGARLEREMSGMTTEEKAAYLKGKTDALRRRQRRLREAGETAGEHPRRRSAA